MGAIAIATLLFGLLLLLGPRIESIAPADWNVLAPQGSVETRTVPPSQRKALLGASAESDRYPGRVLEVAAVVAVPLAERVQCRTADRKTVGIDDPLDALGIGLHGA